MHTSRTVWYLLFLISVIIWFLYFDLNLPFDRGDVFFEGIYFISALVSLYFIQKMDLSRLNLGWGIFTYGLLIDLMDEFTHEPDIADTYFEGLLTIVGLIIITMGFYNAVTRYTRFHKELEQTIESKDMFTDIMRHDLLNPAGIIKGYVQLLKQKEDDEKKLNLIHKIERGNEKIIGIVEKSSKLARLDSVENMEFESSDVSLILKEVVEDYKQNLDDKKIDVELKFNTENKYFAYIDPIIYDAFSNLLSNAIKYNKESGKIIIDILDAGTFWKITITDFGDSIADNNKLLIFERFYRTKNNNNPGSGLGLTIVKKIVELHGGEVGVSDNPDGIGSQFWITLKKSTF